MLWLVVLTLLILFCFIQRGMLVKAILAKMEQCVLPSLVPVPNMNASARPATLASLVRRVSTHGEDNQTWQMNFFIFINLFGNVFKSLI